MQAAIARAGLEDIQIKVIEGTRLSGDDGLRLLACHDINVLGHLANIVRERKNGDTCFFVRNQHINYTNVCNKDCKFCAFYVRVNDPAGYTLSPEDIRRRVEEQAHEPITEIHMVAGINPRLPYAYYLDIIRAVKSARPGVMVKAYTMIEIAEIVRVAKKPLAEVWSELKQAGLDSLPGGGAEVLSDRVHAELFQLKQTPAEWLEMARSAHRAGLRSNATMLYGHIETQQERVEHLLKLREVQDDTGGFLTFIPLAFHPENTELAHLPATTGIDDLKQLAVARLMLDNFDHIKSFWIMVSPQISQLSLWYGADDIDGTILREEITHAAGARTPQGLTRSQLVDLIEQAGRVPVERDPLYRPVASHDGQPSQRNRGEAGIADIQEKVASGERITRADAVRLFGHHDLPTLGAMADSVRYRHWPDPVVTYVIGRNLNYTNVCWVRCKFCAFYRPPGSDEGYTLTREEIGRKIQELVDLGGREVLFQGGLNPSLKLDYYLETFRWIKSTFDVHIHGLSPAEILYIAKMSDLPLDRCLSRLRDAGLDTVPGAGGEILVDRVRRILASGKDMADEWIDFMRTCHQLGIRTSSTMMYGSVETMEERVEHLDRLRALQDETGGFNSFIPWSFQPEQTEMPQIARATAFDYLRTLAIARIYLDNIPSIQASWVTQGAKIAQVSLRFGVNDFGSTVIEENVVSAAGTTYSMDIDEMERLIVDAGFTPLLRDTNYRMLGPYRRPESAGSLPRRGLAPPIVAGQPRAAAKPLSPVN